MAIYDHFTSAELACPCGQCGQGEANMDPTFMYIMVSMRKELGFAFPVTSGFRCFAYNDSLYVALGFAPETHLHGPHTTGHAIDMNLYDGRLYAYMELAFRRGMTGFGQKQHGPRRKRFVHTDNLPRAMGQPRPHMWTYS